MGRKRQYKLKKSEIIGQLYHLQEPVCAICKRSLLPELQIWMKWRLREMDDGKRVRRKDANINIDHIIPVAEGGTDDLSNLALTHRRCNDIRGVAKLYDRRPDRVVES